MPIPHSLASLRSFCRWTGRDLGTGIMLPNISMLVGYFGRIPRSGIIAGVSSFVPAV